MRFLVEALCIFFAFASGYYRNMVLFAIVALAFWAYCLSHGRGRRPRGGEPGAPGPDKNQ